MHRPLSLIALVLVMLTGIAVAHHGDEFFVLEDYEVPSILGGHLSGSFDWEKFNGSDEFSAESMIMLTIAPQIAFSISASAMDHGDGWKYSSVTPRFHFQLTPPDWDFPLRVSFSVGYQIMDGAAGHSNQRVSVVTYEKVYQQVTHTTPATTTTSTVVTEVPVTVTTTTTTTTTVPVTTTTTSGTTTGSGSDVPVDTGGCDPAIDVDCPPAPPHTGHDGPEPTTATTTQTTTQTTSQTSSVAKASSVTTTTDGVTTTTTKVKNVKRVQKVVKDPGLDYSGSIHNHDENLWTARLIIEGDFGKTKALFNLIGLSPEGAAPAWGYAAGVRRQITHSFGLGVEAIGDFASDGMHEVIIGGYVNPSHHLTLKIGAGFGLTEASSDFSLRTGFTYRF